MNRSGNSPLATRSSRPHTDLVPIDPSEVRTDHVWMRVPRGTYSRTAAGPTSFGLVGRVGLTVAVVVAILGLASSVALIFLVAGLPAAAMLLRDIWKKEYVPPPDPKDRPRSAPVGRSSYEALPESARKRLGAPEPSVEPSVVPTPTWLKAVKVAGVLALLALAVTWQLTNEVVHACLLMGASLAALVLVVNWSVKD